MDTLAHHNAHHAHAAARSGADLIGNVIVVTGSEVTVELDPHARSKEKATVGQFMGLMSSRVLIVGMITEVGELAVLPAAAGLPLRKVARLDLLGEVRSAPDGMARFQRGITEYPALGDAAVLLGERELHIVYGTADEDHAHIGDLQQNSQIGVHIDIDNLVSRHFAILGATGVGKSSGVAIILQKILDARPNLRIFLVDPHNEYGHCFGDKAQVLNPRNLRLPFWLFNFEETVDAFFGGRPGIDEEVEILAEVIPLAKSAYLQYRVNNEHPLAKKRNPRDTGFTADTPVPYRIEDLINLLDERMGKLENRNSRMIYHKLIGRIQTFRNHPRYAFARGAHRVARRGADDRVRVGGDGRDRSRGAAGDRRDHRRAARRRHVFAAGQQAPPRRAGAALVPHRPRRAAHGAQDPLGDARRRVRVAHREAPAR